MIHNNKPNMILFNRMKYFFLSILAAVIIASCGNSQNSQEKKFVVKTATATSLAEEEGKSFSFISKPNHTAELSFRVGGQVKHFDTYPGTYFKKGTLIAEIDPRDYSIVKERAAGQLYQAKAEYNRIKVLYEKNNISASTYDKVYADYVAAKTAYESADNNLKDTKLIAPFNGYIGQTYVEQHQDVKAAQSIVSIVEIDQIRLEVYVSGDIAMKAGSIKWVNVRFDALAGKVYSAKVVDISKSTTRNNLSYLLTALLSNPDSSLLPGMSGEIFFGEKTVSPVVTVPQIALSHRPTDGDYLWCVDPVTGVVSKRKVKVGKIMSDGNIAITGNLNEGEEVAISGLRFLSEGMKVVVNKPIN